MSSKKSKKSLKQNDGYLKFCADDLNGCHIVCTCKTIFYSTQVHDKYLKLFGRERGTFCEQRNGG